MSRTAHVKRKTKETDIVLDLELASAQESDIETGVPFLDHMLLSMSRHGRMCLKVRCKGDTEIDDHHSVEDIAICFGQAYAEALGDKKGIVRFGESCIPMDDALTQVSIDLSGRSFFNYTGKELNGYIGKYSEELTLEFLRAFSENSKFTIHVRQLSGMNSHHIHESIFKALGLALFRATRIDADIENSIMSTKGVI